MSKVLQFPSKQINIKNYKTIIKKLTFSMYSHKITYEDGTWRQHWFIVLKHIETGLILEFTPYSKYLRFVGKKKSIDTRRPETLRVKGYFICTFLNFVLIENFEEFQIANLIDITIEHGNRFLQAYADGNISKDKKRKPTETVERLMREIAQFYIWIQHVYGEKAKQIKDLQMIEKVEFSHRQSGKEGFYINTPFQVYVSNCESEEILRDIPTKALTKLINLSKIYYPEITLAICLQAFAGLRIGEVCNIRQEICPIDGGGISYMKIGGKLANFKINLLNKYPMRSDGVDVGSIKKYREQYVYYKFLPILEPIFYKHKEWLDNHGTEPGYYPLIVNKKGMAETTQNYRKKFKKLVNDYLITALSESEDYEEQVYAEILMTKDLAPHSLRHWFTVQLVLNNEPTHSIAGWRGDDNLETSLLYTRNKSELIKLYREATSNLLEDIYRYNLK
ncbi:site-specific integrase [Neobacillus terrae]|uniref:site-specific integrase n=1 Tax=Neobacillus terrae TaxID=3034837 RepID=UPI00140AE70E|nr:site-specific integrase [Neobacillus terrae]NHM32079.1 site-specific integrase [Neobacillus terrae]